MLIQFLRKCNKLMKSLCNIGQKRCVIFADHRKMRQIHLIHGIHHLLGYFLRIAKMENMYVHNSWGIAYSLTFGLTLTLSHHLHVTEAVNKNRYLTCYWVQCPRNVVMSGQTLTMYTRYLTFFWKSAIFSSSECQNLMSIDKN